VIDIDADPLGLDLLLEELEKIDYADYASELRRMIAKLEEGRTFVRLLSDIEILERKKKKASKKFWDDPKQAKQYAYLLELKNQIEQYEESLSIAYMGLTAYDAKTTEYLKKWKADLFDFKIELYSRTYPKANKTFLAIYGIDVQRVVDLYEQIANKKDFKKNIKTIWYRESLYKSTIPFKGDEKVGELLKGRFQKKEYVTIDFDAPASKKFKAAEKGDILCGVVLKLEGISKQNGL